MDHYFPLTSQPILDPCEVSSAGKVYRVANIYLSLERLKVMECNVYQEVIFYFSKRLVYMADS